MTFSAKPPVTMPALDGLRGFAALLVLLSHTSNRGMFALPLLDLRGIGKSGVFLFFLLSSFLLTLQLLQLGDALLAPRNMLRYWQRRVLRIYPLFTLYLLLAVASTWVLANQLDNADSGIPFALDWQGLLAHLTLQEGKGVTWSIAVEFKFYFLLPLAAWLVHRAGRYGSAPPVALLLAAIALCLWLFPASSAGRNDASLTPYLPIFLTGMLAALLQHRLNVRDTPLPAVAVMATRWLGWLAVLALVAMTPRVFSLLGEYVPHNHFHKAFLPYALLWALVMFCAVNVEGGIHSFFSHPLLRFYGTISFSLYLLHPIFINAAQHAGLPGHAATWTVLVSATAIAWLSYKLVEQPFSGAGSVQLPGLRLRRAS
jgi:peptidoglycan/LPS O-acetylase OafA/YrhL